MSDQAVAASGRTMRLREATRAAHERLDNAIMAYDPFSDREAYADFVAMQFHLHQAAEPFFRNRELAALLPDLAQRSRLDKVRLDLADLGRGVPDAIPAPGCDVAVANPVPQGLGWLYVVEGSNLGAAFLLKAATKLGLSDLFGARHLAGDPKGRGLHWRQFTAGIDAVDLTDGDETVMIESARGAFSFAQRLADGIFSARG
ncbi:biliverdin-producing heme oxygenase [Breoghania sp.]|uniref:biliverdin-producing heme oxygenase n=1 Tax=Breoghania sp. TaxID=2065378 RepID=UPI002AAA671B|nr:biliverdin-producing heme oxygenase [Breoghania sp.]